jgi:hypothetical protein
MQKLARSLALAAIGCALATTAAMADGGPGKVVPQTPQVAAAGAPRGYTVVSSGPLTAPNGSSHGEVTCPGTTVPLGGGVFTPSTSTSIAVGSSYPTTTGWAGQLNNVSGAPAVFNVVAVCAKAPKRYQIVAAFPFTVDGNTQASGFAFCPRGTVVLGGGSIANTASVAVNINGTFPSTRTSWQVNLNDNTTAGTTFDVFAICGRKPTGYTAVVGPTVTNRAFEQTEADATCPAGTVPLSGGAFSASGSPAVDLNSTIPTGDGWRVFENNGRTGDTALTALAICAA